jgi:hypothetical protein
LFVRQPFSNLLLNRNPPFPTALGNLPDATARNVSRGRQEISQGLKDYFPGPGLSQKIGKKILTKDTFDLGVDGQNV